MQDAVHAAAEKGLQLQRQVQTRRTLRPSGSKGCIIRGRSMDAAIQSIDLLSLNLKVLLLAAPSVCLLPVLLACEGQALVKGGRSRCNANFSSTQSGVSTLLGDVLARLCCGNTAGAAPGHL